MKKQESLTLLNPDGVNIAIEWDKFVVNSSVFVPCINTIKATHQMRKIAKTRNIDVKVSVLVENGKLGLRIWRIL